MPLSTILAQASNIGGGRIDNLIIPTWVHRVNGSVVLVALVAAATYLSWCAIKRRDAGRPGQIVVAVSQVALMIQALLGIKLLDQGQGIVQLYIHYVGGLIPLGLFLGIGWFRSTDHVKRTRTLAVIADVSLVVAVMAYTIGQAYARGTL